MLSDYIISYLPHYKYVNQTKHKSSIAPTTVVAFVHAQVGYYNNVLSFFVKSHQNSLHFFIWRQ